ncbi:MAG: cbb3-type cytochrome c oxidase subunit 3 [Acidovorax sp.]
MDITTLRIAVTLLSMAIFVGICIWACAGRNQHRFDEAARLPFEEN